MPVKCAAHIMQPAMITAQKTVHMSRISPSSSRTYWLVNSPTNAPIRATTNDSPTRAKA